MQKRGIFTAQQVKALFVGQFNDKVSIKTLSTMIYNTINHFEIY